MKIRPFYNCYLLRHGKLFIFMMLCGLLLPAVSGSVDKERFEPYIEKHANGWIDWKNGKIYGIGRGYLYKNASSRPRAQAAASVVASGNILKLAAGLHLDDKNTLKALGKGRVVVHLKAFMRDSTYKSVFVDNVKKPYYEVTKVAQIKGIQGLTAKLLTHLKSTKIWKDFPIKPLISKLDDEDQPWLVVDARDLDTDKKVEPALFPKIKSETGETVYELKEIEEAALINRGMMQYVVSSESKDELRSDRGSIERILARAGFLLPVQEAHATNSRKRKKRGRFIVADAQQVEGLAKTNLVISEQDAQKLKAEDRASQILKKCRVIVIVSSPIGGIEGKVPRYLASAPRF